MSLISTEQEYAELLALTKRFLLQNQQEEIPRFPKRPASPPQKPTLPPSKPEAAVAPSTPPPTTSTLSPPSRSVEANDERVQATQSKGDLEAIRQLIAKAHPSLSISTEIPPDEKARSVMQQHSQRKEPPAVLIITMQNTPQALAFLQKIADAVGSLNAAAAVLTMPSHETLRDVLLNQKPRFILIDREPLHHDSFLSAHYEYDATTDSHFLCGRPIYPIPSVQQLSQNPHEKARLWQQLKLQLQ